MAKGKKHTPEQILSLLRQIEVEPVSLMRDSARAKSIAPYRQCSAGRVRRAEDFGASIVDTAICAKPGEVLAGQLLYGDSIPRSYFGLT
jgi:hypothetical protein